MKKSISIFWFRRDLRLEDNCGLFNALNSGNAIVPIFIFDTTILKELPKNDARISFIYQQLEKINNELQKIGSGLLILKGKPIDIYKELLRKYTIKSVFTNHDYEPYAIKRDTEIKKMLEINNISFHTYKDQVIFERNEIVKSDGTPYKVYTPFSKKWLETLKKETLTFYPSEKFQHYFSKMEKIKFLSQYACRKYLRHSSFCDYHIMNAFTYQLAYKPP